MKIRFEHLQQVVNRIVTHSEREVIKEIEVEMHSANPGEGVPTDMMIFTVTFSRGVHNNKSKAFVTRVVEVFPLSDAQNVKITETQHWDVE